MPQLRASVRKDKARAMDAVRLKGLPHGLEIEREGSRRCLRGVLGGTGLEQQNAVVDAGYGVAQQAPHLGGQQRIMHAGVADSKAQ